MKFSKSIFSLLVILVCITDSNAQFRNSNWGDSKDEVMAIEGRQEYPADTIVYGDTVGGINTFVFFTFIDNSLESGSYVFNEKYSDKVNYLEDYLEIHDTLVKKYGEPTAPIERVVKNKEIESSKFLNEMNKIELGGIAFQAKWNVPDMIILHKLTNNDGDVPILHALTYKSLHYDKLAEEKTLSDF